MARRKTNPQQGFTLNNKVQLIRGGAPYFNLLEELIDKAEDTIHFQTYIFDADETGNKVIDALCRAGQRKIKVFLLIDGYASKNFPKEAIEKLKENNVHFRWFEPLFRSSDFYFGRRLHHKILVVDAKYSVVGGGSVSNKYSDRPNQPGWLDWALLTEGEACIELCRVCVEMVEKRSSSKRRKKIPVPEKELFSF